MAVADMLSALRIKANLIADRTVGLMEINTEVHDGMAILTGEVETEEQRHVAEELAYQVDGIEEVDNEIKVVPPAPGEMPLDQETGAHLGYSRGEVTFEQLPGLFSDDEIANDVRDRLASQDKIDVSGIRMHVANQVVHLSGIVNTQEDINQLQDMIMGVRGVMGIDSNVEVRWGNIEPPNNESG